MTRIAILVLGALGFVVVGRAAAYYAGVDGVALSVTCTMGLVLAAGIVELLRTVSQVEALRSELQKADANADETWLDAASGPLRALLRSRLERAPMAVPQPTFAPYLVGLLVMLGLLGTFLGLFETLRGARAALTQTGDLEALRAGLVRPMAGLVRSFGTSAAGVAGSAVLGLASVFARRSCSDLGRELGIAVAGPFARLAPSARELLAIERLAEQGRSLPRAADALEKAASDLSALGEKLPALQQASLDGIRSRLESSVASIEKQLSATATSIGQQLTETSATMSSQLQKNGAAIGESLQKSGASMHEQLQKSGASMHEQLQKSSASMNEQLQKSSVSTSELLQRSVAEMKKSIEEASKAIPGAAIAAIEPHVGRALEKSSTAAVEHLDAVREAIRADGELRRESDARVAEAATRHLKSLEDGLAETRLEQARALDAALRGLAESLETRLGALTDAETTRVATVTESVQTSARSILDALSASDRARSEATTSTVETLVRSIEARLDALAGTLAQAFEAGTRPAAESLSTLATSLGTSLNEATAPVGDRLVGIADELARTSTTVRERAERDAEATRAAEERLAQLFARLEEASERVGRAAAEQSSAVDRVVAAAEARIETSETASEERLRGLLDRIDAMVEADRERTSALDTALRTSTTNTASEVASLLAAHAKELSTELEKTQALVHEAASLVHAGGAELESLATAFGESVDRHRQAADEWLANLGKVEAAVVSSGEAAAADVLGQQLARAHEMFDRQLRFQNELLERLRSFGSAPNEATAEDAPESASPVPAEPEPAAPIPTETPVDADSGE